MQRRKRRLQKVQRGNNKRSSVGRNRPLSPRPCSPVAQRVSFFYQSAGIPHSKRPREIVTDTVWPTGHIQRNVEKDWHACKMSGTAGRQTERSRCRTAVNLAGLGLVMVGHRNDPNRLKENLAVHSAMHKVFDAGQLYSSRHFSSPSNVMVQSN